MVQELFEGCGRSGTHALVYDAHRGSGEGGVVADSFVVGTVVNLDLGAEIFNGLVESVVFEVNPGQTNMRFVVE